MEVYIQGNWRRILEKNLENMERGRNIIRLGQRLLFYLQKKEKKEKLKTT